MLLFDGNNDRFGKFPDINWEEPSTSQNKPLPTNRQKVVKSPVAASQRGKLTGPEIFAALELYRKGASVDDLVNRYGVPEEEITLLIKYCSPSKVEKSDEEIFRSLASKTPSDNR